MSLQHVSDDIWNYSNSHYVVIPTNARGVMGRGLAYQAKKKYPGLQLLYRSHCDSLDLETACWPACLPPFSKLILFPVKKNWADRASVGLIVDNLNRLEAGNCFCTLDENIPIAMPELGCGFGELDWKTIGPVIEEWAKLIRKLRVLLVHPSEVIGERYADSMKPGARKDARFS